jgi:hypothetical protein
MAEKCKCGHVHCCHVPVIVEMDIEDRYGRKIGRRMKRRQCSKCSGWLGDEPI